MDTKTHRVNLTQKHKSKNGRWLFYPVHWENGKPDPRFIIIDDQLALWERGGAYFLDWREDGKRKRKQVGTDRARHWMHGEKPPGWRMAPFPTMRENR